MSRCSGGGAAGPPVTADAPPAAGGVTVLSVPVSGPSLGCLQHGTLHGLCVVCLKAAGGNRSDPASLPHRPAEAHRGLPSRRSSSRWGLVSLPPAGMERDCFYDLVRGL